MEGVHFVKLVWGERGYVCIYTRLTCKLVQLPRDVGMEPFNCALGKLSVTSLFNRPMDGGIEPEKKLPPRSSFSNWISWEISSGIEPVR